MSLREELNLLHTTDPVNPPSLRRWQEAHEIYHCSRRAHRHDNANRAWPKACHEVIMDHSTHVNTRTGRPHRWKIQK